MTFTTVTVQLSTHTLLSLIAKLRRRGGSADLSEAIADVVDFWLADPARFEPGADASGVHGVVPSKKPRNTDREPGWDLPERRKFRYRLEDVAY